ncbi:MAG: RHS repeat-associated core domain-containing protein [Bacteroidales bacterium]|nr:RHS repeat-associated core domain-containing protein [Bacteroidales bacterium]
MNPHLGIQNLHRNALGYRYSSPNGDNLLFGITGNPSDLPHLSVHCSLLTVHWTYTFSAKEKDSETGLSYFGSRYYSSDLSIWLSVDPMSDKYPSLSPYVYCANNPVKVVDPNGEEIDWVENLTSGEVIWMQDVTCQENTPDGYRYVGAKYDLPDGSGSLGNVSYNTYGGNRYLGDNESAMAEINIEFIPTDSKKSYNWVQTYSTNFFTDSNGEFAFDRITDSYSDYVDCGAQSTDPTISCFFNPYQKTTTLSDGNRRFVGSGKEIGMHFTSSVVNSSDNSRVVSIKWGYSISADGYASFIPPTITSSINNFHKTAIQYAK